MSDPLGPLPEGVDADPEYEKKLVSPATIKVRMLSSGDQAIWLYPYRYMYILQSVACDPSMTFRQYTNTKHVAILLVYKDW